ncbi:hypothetical protein D3C77_389140 [compost metagenome]|jgi:hypothetical protein
MNMFGFCFFVLSSGGGSLLLNRCLKLLSSAILKVALGLLYNSLMIVFYIDAIKKGKLLFIEFDPSITAYHPTILAISTIMVFFHLWTFRTEI